MAKKSKGKKSASPAPSRKKTPKASKKSPKLKEKKEKKKKKKGEDKLEIKEPKIKSDDSKSTRFLLNPDTMTSEPSSQSNLSSISSINIPSNSTSYSGKAAYNDFMQQRTALNPYSFDYKNFPLTNRMTRDKRCHSEMSLCYSPKTFPYTGCKRNHHKDVLCHNLLSPSRVVSQKKSGIVYVNLDKSECQNDCLNRRHCHWSHSSLTDSNQICHPSDYTSDYNMFSANEKYGNSYGRFPFNEEELLREKYNVKPPIRKLSYDNFLGSKMCDDEKQCAHQLKNSYKGKIYKNQYKYEPHCATCKCSADSHNPYGFSRSNIQNISPDFDTEMSSRTFKIDDSDLRHPKDYYLYSELGKQYQKPQSSKSKYPYVRDNFVMKMCGCNDSLDSPKIPNSPKLKELKKGQFHPDIDDIYLNKKSYFGLEDSHEPYESKKLHQEQKENQFPKFCESREPHLGKDVGNSYLTDFKKLSPDASENPSTERKLQSDSKEFLVPAFVNMKKYQQKLDGKNASSNVNNDHVSRNYIKTQYQKDLKRLHKKYSKLLDSCDYSKYHFPEQMPYSSYMKTERDSSFSSKSDTSDSDTSLSMDRFRIRSQSRRFSRADSDLESNKYDRFKLGRSSLSSSRKKMKSRFSIPRFGRKSPPDVKLRGKKNRDYNLGSQKPFYRYGYESNCHNIFGKNWKICDPKHSGDAKSLPVYYFSQSEANALYERAILTIEEMKRLKDKLKITRVSAEK